MVHELFGSETSGPRGGRLIAAVAASPPPGLSRSQQKSTLRTRQNLPPVLEVPLEEPEPEAPPSEPKMERRVPYSLHVVSHFPNNKHLKEESQTRQTIEEKICNAFQHSEDLIRHVEVNLQVSENFHRDDPAHHHKPKVVTQEDSGELVRPENDAPRMLTPYIFKVTVSLKNGRTIVLANAEKHAQPTLSEGLDHMVDVVRNSLREEKDKEIKLRKKKAVEASDLSGDTGLLDDADAEGVVDELESRADAEMEQLYQKVESSADPS